MRREWTFLVLGCALLVGPLAGSVKGDTVPHNTIFADLVSASEGQFNYELYLTGGSEIRDTAYVTIFDVAGLIGTPTFSLGNEPDAHANQLGGLAFFTTVATSPTGVAPVGTLPNDLPAVPNVTIRFNNANPSAAFQVDSETLLGTLTLQSSYSAFAWGVRNVASFDFHGTGTSSSLTDTQVPVSSSGSSVNAVPLPSAAWGGLALLGVISAARLSRAGRGTLQR